MPPVTIKKAALTYRAKIEGGKRLIETEAGFLPEAQAGVVIDETPLETTMATRVAGERPFVAQSEGGVLATIPATTHYIRCPPGVTTIIKAPDSTGGIDDFIVELFYNVTVSATSTITATDGAGVTQDGALSNWPLLGANAPVGPGRIADIKSLRSKTGPWGITPGAGVEVVAGVVTK